MVSNRTWDTPYCSMTWHAEKHQCWSCSFWISTSVHELFMNDRSGLPATEQEKNWRKQDQQCKIRSISFSGWLVHRQSGSTSCLPWLLRLQKNAPSNHGATWWLFKCVFGGFVLSALLALPSKLTIKKQGLNHFLTTNLGGLAKSIGRQMEDEYWEIAVTNCFFAYHMDLEPRWVTQTQCEMLTRRPLNIAIEFKTLLWFRCRWVLSSNASSTSQSLLKPQLSSELRQNDRYGIMPWVDTGVLRSFFGVEWRGCLLDACKSYEHLHTAGIRR